MKLRLAFKIMMFLCYAALAGSVNTLFMIKHGFSESNKRSNLEKMFEGTANRPFIYRQLMIRIADAIDKAMPETSKKLAMVYLDQFELRKHFFQEGFISWDKYGFRYHLLYWFDFLAILISLLMLRQISSKYFESAILVNFAPLAFGLLLPTVFKYGGYFYDFPNLMFITMFSYYYVTRRFYAVWIVYLLAVLNKESSVLLPFIMIPSTFLTQEKYFSVKQLVGLIVSGAIVLFSVRYHFAANPGYNFEYHMWDNIHYDLNPLTYITEWHDLYGAAIPFPAYNNIIILLPLLYIIYDGWSYADKSLHCWLVTATALSFPLFVWFGYYGEFRALDLMFIPIYLIIGMSLDHYFSRKANNTVIIRE